MTIDQAMQLARQHHSAARLREAEPIYRQVLAVQPSHAEAMHLLGLLAFQCGAVEPGIDLMSKSIALSPNVFYWYANIGQAYRTAGKMDDAIAAFRRFLDLKPDDPEGLHNLAVTLEKAGKLDEALPLLERCIALHPRYPRAYMSLGVLREHDLRYDDALALYEHAVALDPNYPRARAARAGMWLMKADLSRGFAEYEWRWRVDRFPGRMPTAGIDLWDGSPLDGKPLLLYHEQGLGDTIMFARYARFAAQRGARVIVECPASLARLIASADGVSEVITSKIGRGVVPIDHPAPQLNDTFARVAPYLGQEASRAPVEVAFQLPLMSMPRVIGTTLQTIPGAVPYLRIDDTLIEQWRARLGETPPASRRIGLCWHGGQSQPHRSIPLAELTSLLQSPGVQFINLTKDLPDADRAFLNDRGIINVMDAVTDMADTAAIIMSLDLVISIDTATAHLAGALARPVWILLAARADWRWLQTRDDSPWYPTARLFRQQTSGDWSDLVTRVSDALRTITWQ